MPTIIGQNPPTNSVAFGLDLSGYFPQPGTEFQVSRYGFDTGRRKFLVNKSVTTSDPFVVGTQDFEYPEMFVDKVTYETLGGPWSMVDIDYLGLIQKPKPPHFEIDADARSNVSVAYGITIYGIAASLTTVQVITVTDVEPDFGGAGEPAAPPITIPPPNLDAWAEHFGLPAGSFPIYGTLWYLEKKQVRIAGLPPGSGFQNPRILSGKTVMNTDGTVTGIGTHFLTEVAVGNTLFPYPYQLYHTFQFLNGTWFITGNTGVASGKVDSVGSDTHLHLNGFFGVPYYLVPPNFIPEAWGGQIQAVGFPPPSAAINTGVIGSAMYEVTDSYKRLIAINPTGFIQ